MRFRHTEIQTKDIDLAAVYLSATGLKPTLVREDGDSLVTFLLLDNETTRSVMLEYATGLMELNIKNFAAHRSWLYRQTREVKS